ncbi:UNKNOWN [Stylonychia lemnae]|uniref:Uncharacterized protein n=1 Tax=Stylonychia lemnae TaxID=5949 RepID=A0A078AZP9_STYLE|nr:UNKNOWN [Stylonychia lemnae]|eukprot:CDW87576.1 UNKNOWN [Stylonychia lemnae]
MCDQKGMNFTQKNQPLNYIDQEFLKRVPLFKLSGFYQISESINDIDLLSRVNHKKLQLDMLVYYQGDPSKLENQPEAIVNNQKKEEVKHIKGEDESEDDYYDYEDEEEVLKQQETQKVQEVKLSFQELKIKEIELVSKFVMIKKIPVLDNTIKELRLVYQHERLCQYQFKYLELLINICQNVQTVQITFKELIHPQQVSHILEIVLKIVDLQIIALQILYINDEKYSIIDIQSIIYDLRQQLKSKQRKIKLLFKCQVKERSAVEYEGSALKLVQELQQVEDTIGLDLFYYRASVFNDNLKHLFDIQKLKELHIFPLTNPNSFLDELEQVRSSHLSALQLGIMNIKEKDFQRLFTVVPKSFPNLSNYSLQIQYIDFAKESQRNQRLTLNTKPQSRLILLNMEELAYAPNFKTLKVVVENQFVFEQFIMDRKQIEHMNLENITLKGPCTFNIMINGIFAIQNLREIYLIDCEFANQNLFNQFCDALNLLPKLKSVSLDNLQLLEKNKTLCLISLFDFLKENKQVQKLSIQSMNLGEQVYDYENLSTLLLYNEYLEVLDLSKNKLSNVFKMFTNLVRNRCSNILSINLSDNLIEIEDFTRLMGVLDKESSFGHLHFKLRLLNLHQNPMKDFDFKVQKLLSSYYQSKHQKLMILASNYQIIPPGYDNERVLRDIINNADVYS